MISSAQRPSRRMHLVSVFALLTTAPLIHACSDNNDPDPMPADAGIDTAPDAPSGDTHNPPDAATQDAAPTNDASPDSNATPLARLLVFARDGHVASLELTAPHTRRATSQLQAEIQSAKCQDWQCAVVHGDPVNRVDIIDAATLSINRTLTLADKSDPRDATWLDGHTLLVTQYNRAELIVFNTTTGAKTPISLAGVADDDQLPEAGHVSSCGSTAYVQIARVDHESNAPTLHGSGIAVIDWSRQAGDRIVDVDPSTAGVQAIALPGPADFDMPIDCSGKRLYMAEPKPLFSGGGNYQVVNLVSFAVSDFPFTNGAQVGGFVVLSENLGWRITHTEFGPGASSHLELVGAGTFDTHNTFSGDHVDDLAYDAVTDLLFFPDPCMITPANQGCQRGVHVFKGHTGARATTTPLEMPFAPLEVAIARTP